MSKFIVAARSDKIFQALHDAGVFNDDPDYVRRVVIDLQAGSLGRIYVERFADDRLTEVLLNGGIEIVEKPAAERRPKHECAGVDRSAAASAAQPRGGVRRPGRSPSPSLSSMPIHDLERGGGAIEPPALLAGMGRHPIRTRRVMRRIDPSEFDTQLCATTGCGNDLTYTEAKAGLDRCEECRGSQSLLVRTRSEQTRQPLTAAELDVLQLVALGFTNTEISARRSTSPETTKTHVKTIAHKLGAASRAHSVAIALRTGLIS